MMNLHVYIQAITLFVSCADHIFGLITTICKEGCVVKDIPWSVFMLLDDEWCCVAIAWDILAVSQITYFWPAFSLC